MERSAPSFELNGGNGIWIPCCPPTLCLAIPPSLPHAAGDSSPPLKASARTDVSSLRSGSSLWRSEGDCHPSHRELLVRRWHEGGDGQWTPCTGWGHIVTKPRTIFQAPRQAPGQECHGEETPYKNSRFSSARHLCTPEPQGSSLFLCACSHQCLLSPGPQVTDASSSSPLKQQLELAEKLKSRHISVFC